MAHNYPKINTIFQRSESNNTILEGTYSKDYFQTLKDLKWEATEKVDGTNICIRAEFCYYSGTPEPKISFLGHTDKSQIPAFLISKLQEITSKFDWSIFSKQDQEGNTIYPSVVTLHGEGYGNRIQGCGSLFLFYLR